MIHASNAILNRGVVRVNDGFDPVRTGFDLLGRGATVYFALISAIAFAHVMHRKAYSEYLRSRFFAVIVPYVVVTIALTLALAGRGGLDPAVVAELPERIGRNILLGKAWNTLWYIPVIAILYVLSPLLLRLVNTRALTWLAVLLALLPLVVSRTGTTITPQMIVYFAGVYIVGLAVGRDVDRWVCAIASKWRWFAVAAIASVLTICLLDIADFDTLGHTSLVGSAFYVFRLSSAGLILVALKDHVGKIPVAGARFLKLAATYSFGIYFVHGPLLRPIAKAVGGTIPPDQPAWALVAGAVFTFVLGLALSIAIVALVRKIAGRWSRQLIGS